MDSIKITLRSLTLSPAEPTWNERMKWQRQSRRRRETHKKGQSCLIIFIRNNSLTRSAEREKTESSTQVCQDERWGMTCAVDASMRVERTTPISSMITLWDNSACGKSSSLLWTFPQLSYIRWLLLKWHEELSFSAEAINSQYHQRRLSDSASSKWTTRVWKSIKARWAERFSLLCVGAEWNYERKFMTNIFLAFPEIFNELAAAESAGEARRKIHNFIHISSLNFLRHATAAKRVSWRGEKFFAAFNGWALGLLLNLLKIENCRWLYWFFSGKSPEVRWLGAFLIKYWNSATVDMIGLSSLNNSWSINKISLLLLVHIFLHRIYGEAHSLNDEFMRRLALVVVCWFKSNSRNIGAADTIYSRAAE